MFPTSGIGWLEMSIIPDNIYYSLLEVSRYSGVPGILYFLLFSKKKDKCIKIVFYILLASFLADFFNYFFIRLVYKNGFIISNSWVIINFILVTWYFYELIPKRRTLILLFLGVFIVALFVSFGFFYSFLQPNTVIRVLGSITFSTLSLLCLWEILKESPTDQLFKYPVFWIVTAIFLYSSITIFRNLFQNYFLHGLGGVGPIGRWVWFFNLVFNPVKNFIFLYAFYLVNKGYPNYIYRTNHSTGD